MSAGPRFGAMDKLNQALFDLKSTIRALHHIGAHVRDTTENEECRDALWRVLMADLGLVEAAEREAWAVVVKGGAPPATAIPSVGELAPGEAA